MITDQWLVNVFFLVFGLMCAWAFISGTRSA